MIVTSDNNADIIPLHDFTDTAFMNANSVDFRWRSNITTSTTYQLNLTNEMIMWTKPAATEMRFGFEVTMYVMNK